MAKYFNPWMEIQGMKDKMDKLMDEVRERFDFDQNLQERTAMWQPVTDAYETAKAYYIQMELAGLSRGQITIELKDGELWVYGERRMIKDVCASTYQILERSYGPFARKFSLPHQANSSEISGTFENGLLTITIPKSDSSEHVHKIEVTEE